MRILLLAAALVLSACGQNASTQSANACARSVTHEVTWSADGAPDTIATTADGPTCAQAVVTFVVRNAAGDPLWAFASTYYDLTMGGVPPEGAAPVSGEQMDTFLAAWANVTEERTAAFLPEWREGVATLSASAQTFSYSTPFDREIYERLRTQDLKLICYQAAVEGTHCLIIDPASHAPIMMVAYGP
ncbi:MAG: hypothetical protein R3C27_04270 [Hyphomonadaceae bacterium]